MNNKKKIVIIVLIVLLAVLLLAGYAFFWINARRSASISIIGGADGPTTIFVAGKLGDDEADQTDTEMTDSGEGTSESNTDVPEVVKEPSDAVPYIPSVVGVESDVDIATLPLGMYMQVIGYDGTNLTVLIINSSGYEMYYGNEYDLAIQEDDLWVDVPAEDEPCWTEEINTIADMTTDTVSYDVSCYGVLKKGRYRLMKADMSADFELK